MKPSNDVSVAQASHYIQHMFLTVYYLRSIKITLVSYRFILNMLQAIGFKLVSVKSLKLVWYKIHYQ